MVATIPDSASKLWVPINPEDVPALEELLRREHPFVSVAIDCATPYSLAGYVEHDAAGGPRIHALLDRNLTSRVAELASGCAIDHSAESSKSDRVAAACMAFLAAAKVALEPNISLYEFASTAGDARAFKDLRSLRLAQAIQPQAYLNVALQRASEIHPEAIQDASGRTVIDAETEPFVNFLNPLRHFRCHRALVTKIALLDRTGMNGPEKYRQLLRWSSNAGFFDGTALAFGAIFFGTHRAGKMLKSVRSDSFDRCVAGIKNASWDLTYISHWISRAREDGERAMWTFCTYDWVCASVARSTVGPEGDSLGLFTQNFKSSDAVSLHDEYCDLLVGAPDSDERREVVRQRFESLDDLQLDLDGELSRAINDAG